jgi:hypothetical protein
MPPSDHYDPDKDLLSDVIDDALDFTPTNDPDEPRDPAWLRWSKFAAIMFGCAVLVGAVFAFEDYVEQYSARNDYERTRAEKRVEHDSMGELKFRLFLGGGIGAALGGIYVVRCLLRKVDP